jgi:hypothetical protein
MANPNIVNVTSILGAALTTTLISTANTTLLVNTASSGVVYKIENIIAANILASSTAILNLQINNGTNNRSIVSTLDIPVNTTIIPIDKTSSFYLTEGYSLKGSSGTNTSIDLIVNYEVIS